LNFQFIVNPASGPARDPNGVERTVRRVLSSAGHAFEVRRTEGPGHGTVLARRAASAGAGVVVAVGGDGTFRDVAAGLIGSRAVLGIVPTGSGNGFARALGVPRRVEDAVRALLKSGVHRLDVGRVNEELFFNVAGVGLDARVASAYADNQKGGRRGIWPYVGLALREYRRFRPEPAVLTLGDEKIELTPLMVAIANGPQFGAGLRIAPGAVFDDGLFDVVTVDAAPWWRVAPGVARMFLGRFPSGRPFARYKAAKIRLDFSCDQPYHLDGEPRRGRGLSVDLVPKGVAILSPLSDSFGAAPEHLPDYFQRRQ